MANPLFSRLSGGQQENPMISQFKRFCDSFTGDPQQKVQELLNSGRMSQSDFNRYSQMARQMQGMFGGNKS